MRKGFGLSFLLAVSSVWASPTDRYTSLIGESNHFLLKSQEFDPLTQKSSGQGKRIALEKSADGTGVFLIQFHEAPTAEMLEELGGEVLRYIPSNSYLVRLDDNHLKSVKNKSLVRWCEPLWPEYRIDPLLLEKTQGDDVLRVVIFLWDDSDTESFCDRIVGLGGNVNGRPMPGQRKMVFASATHSVLEKVASFHEVEWIEPEPVLEVRNDQETWTVQSGIEGNRSIWDEGIMGEGQVIGHLDESLDASSCYFRDDSGEPVGPDHRKLVGMLEAGSSEAHGTHTAAIAAGRRNDFSLVQAGHAPDAKLFHGDYRNLIPGRGADVSHNFTDLKEFFGEAQILGAEVFTNSWGQDNNTRYTYLARAIDDYTWNNEDAVVVFAATNGDTLGSPENAKNVIAVGSSYGPFDVGPNGEPGYDVIRGGGQGPTFDGRLKPDVFVPGYQVISAVPGNCVTDVKTGTSMACPAVAASASLIRQYFMDGFYPTGAKNSDDEFTPSGALVRAVLLNSTRDMTSVEGYPNIQEGWGRLLLEDALYFNHDDRYLSVIDGRRSEGDGLRTGEEESFTLLVEDDAEPLKVTLCWMDPPAAHHASLATINNLDLELVSPEGYVYYGNVFQGGVSVPDGDPDVLNNIEQILIPNPTEGFWEVRIKGTFVESSSGEQGYAMVTTGNVAMASMRKALSFIRPVVGPESGANVILLTQTDPVDWPEVVFTSEAGDREVIATKPNGIGRFDASLPVSVDSQYTWGDGVLSVEEGEVVQASYTERLQSPVVSQAVVDVAPPVLQEFTTSDNRGYSVVVHVELNEQGMVDLLGKQRESGIEFEFPMVLMPDDNRLHSVRVTDLEPATQYSLYFDMEDQVLNQRIDRNGGIGHWVSTWEEIRFWGADFDLTDDGFTSELIVGSTLWTREILSGSPAPKVMAVESNSTTLDSYLLMPPLRIGSNSDRGLLSFSHQYSFPENRTGGGVLEIAFNDGVWQDAGDLVLDAGYTGSIDKTLSILPGRNAWSGTTGDEWVKTVLDLTAYNSNSFELRWRVGVDQPVQSDFYWYIDDVRFWELVETTPQFTDPINLWMLY